MAKNDFTDSLLEFIQNSPSPFHAVERCEKRLRQFCNGKALVEGKPWEIHNTQTYYTTRQGGSFLGFKIPSSLGSSVTFNIICAHTDSPCLKLKPRQTSRVENYYQWGTEVYGGILNNSWLDRDLYIAGRVSFIDNGKLVSKNVNITQFKCRIPQLAIHLDRNVNDGLKLNPQDHLVPILGLENTSSSKELMAILKKEAKVPASVGEDLISFDLFLYDAADPSYGGIHDEFIYASRLDNLAMCHAGLEALATIEDLPGPSINVVALFDHEEVGSQSASGASSNFLYNSLEKIAVGLGKTREEFMAGLAKSFLISADMAHALHPNYYSRHDPDHKPLIGKGPVIKGNANLRYATNSESTAKFKDICQQANIPFQEFVNRSDLACGTTIGPITASLTGISVVDVGSPMLSMHSAREMAGSEDHSMILKVFKQFYKS